MKTKRTTLAGSIALACMVTSTMASSAAFGAEYTYRVEKANLGVGQARVETLKAKTNQTLSSTILGIKFEVVCKKLKLDAAEEPVIKGGIPGTSARNKLEFSECEAHLGSSNCGATTVEGGNLTGELVTVLLPATREGKLATRYTPSGGAGGTFAKVKMSGCGGLTVTFSGTVALLDTPEKTEQSVGTLAAKAGSEEIAEVRKSNGTKEQLALKCEGLKASFAGESELSLLSNENWGVF